MPAGYRKRAPMTAKRSKRPSSSLHILCGGTYFAATAAQFPSGAMSASAHRPSSQITIFGLALVWTLAPVSPGAAHDSWINRGAYRNPAGEWCCGDNDCESPDRVAVTGKGWVVRGTEFVPFEEATPSPDGKVWICRRPDRTRRCVFGPPPGS
jgi:hypothetical protein